MESNTKKRIISRSIALLLVLILVTMALPGAMAADNETDEDDDDDGINYWAILGGVLQLILGIVLALFAIWLGIKILDKMTPKVPIWKEIKKKNLAVGIAAASVVVSISMCISSGIEKFASGFSDGLDWWLIGGAVVTVFVGLIFGIFGIWIALKVLDKMTPDIPLQEQLKEGNLAWGLLVGGVLFAISNVIAGAVGGIAGGLGL